MKADERWAVVVAPDLKSREELVTLAFTVWAQERNVRGIHIFSSRDFGAYLQWTKRWPSSEVEYPAEWARKHHVGMVNRQLSAGRAPGESRVFLTIYQEEKFGGDDWVLIE